MEAKHETIMVVCRVLAPQLRAAMAADSSAETFPSSRWRNTNRYQDNQPSNKFLSSGIVICINFMFSVFDACFLFHFGTHCIYPVALFNLLLCFSHYSLLFLAFFSLTNSNRIFFNVDYYSYANKMASTRRYERLNLWNSEIIT